MRPEDLFAEPTLKQVTVWSRGVILGKEGRDVAFALANAAMREGKHVQAFENYVDLPDRVNVPVTAYARISAEPIESRFLYENYAHDVVVIVEESLIRGPVLDHITPGAVLVVNSKRPAAELARLLPRHPNLESIVTVDASGISSSVKSLSGQEGATDATGIGGGWAGPLAGAVVRATGLATLESLLAVVKDPRAAQRGYETATVTPAQELFERGLGKPWAGDSQPKRYLEAPFAGTVEAPGRRNDKMVTGTWRITRPVLTPELCTQCMICVVDCPDACITLTETAVQVDYEYCKGCGICTQVCPTEAFKDVPELDFAV